MSTHPEEDEVEDGEILDSKPDDIVDEEDEEIDFDEEPDLIGLMTSLMATPEEQAIQGVIDQIWDTYDVDKSGALDKDETKKFV